MRVEGTSQVGMTVDTAVEERPLQVTGGPEALIAQVSVQLEESGDQMRAQARRARESRNAQQRRQLSKQRKAAVVQLVGSLVQAGGTAASGLVTASADPGQTGAVDKAKGRGDIISGTAGALQAGGQFITSRLEEDAQDARFSAERHGEVADAADDAAESAQRFVDKAMGHMDGVARARHEAMMAAIRG